MNEFNTPMMKQYKEIKSKYEDCLLLYRMGDFYELFLEDAHIGSQVLNITLTGKSNGKNDRIPMAGVPYHALDTYLAKLVKAGYKVAICEQLSPPNKKGLVKRDVVRVITPGTILDEKILGKKENNHILCVDIQGNTLAVSYADISTGFFGTYEKQFDDVSQILTDELSKLSPVECILPEKLYNDPEMLKLFVRERGLNVYPLMEWDQYTSNALSQIKEHFNIVSLETFGIPKGASLVTASALLGYLKQTQKSTISHVRKITYITGDDGMVLDRASMLNLELFSTIRDNDPKGALITVMDQTLTPMGGRMLKSWMKQPLINKGTIELRHAAVSELVDNYTFNTKIRDHLTSVSDIERLLSRLSVNVGNARDLVNLKLTLEEVLRVKETMLSAKSTLLRSVEQKISNTLSEVITCIDTVIIDDAPIDVKSGGIIKDGVNKELDKLRKLVGGSRGWMDTLEQEEREKTGINSLKIKFNKVFGFYIEVSKSNLHLVPDNYQRKQTLVNGERFITPELKHHEEIILTAEERMNELEYSLFIETLEKVLTYTETIQNAANIIALLDCISNFAELSTKNNYVKPTMVTSGEIIIQEGRHPVVEKLIDIQQFVPNDVTLGIDLQRQLLITGPNMAGKSVLIRQVAHIVLMAQMGCFVPARAATLSVVDRIFVRSGASDVITSGLSTFMVEMVETAHILHHATKDSLIIMDEIGRGTSTYDGISIAWAVAEYLATHYAVPPKTLFATHYHELQALEEKYPKTIKNFHMAVADDKGSPIFLHTIVNGGASHSFGVAVAKLAGVPEDVITNAQSMLHKLEARGKEPSETSTDELNPSYTVPTTQIVDMLLHNELEKIDISQLTPLEALNKLAEIKEKLKLASKKSEIHAD